jgi:glutamyl/glutaminyl-tRNA synthetase
MDLPDLTHAIPGKVITRFPPEASGYLHLGHVKALMLNHLYAKKYNGKIILRFDDTNPDKENKLYEQTIEEDIHTLGLDCDLITYTSDYFDQMIRFAIKLISSGLAYVDSTDPDTIQALRGVFQPSLCRDTDPETNLNLFQQMIDGTITDSCVRAKIDFASKNGCMRDPVIYRSKNTVHPRTGIKYKIYPTYDFACPIVDSIEGITHCMRSIEYKDRDAQYNWFLDAMDLRHGDSKQFPIIKEYGKMNFTHTVLSKRKLSKLVEAGLVESWADPRMPTVRGILRRGMQVEKLLQYIQLQGFSTNIVLLSWDKLWSMNSDTVSEKAHRLYGLVAKNVMTVQLNGLVPDHVDLPFHPKNPDMGSRKMHVTSDIQVDKADFMGSTYPMPVGTRYTLVGLGNATLTSNNPYVLTYDPLDKDFKKTIKITWLPSDAKKRVTVRKYYDLLTKPKLDDKDDIVDCFNRDSLITYELIVEDTLYDIPMSVIQIMRMDYYRVNGMDDKGQIELVVIPVK